MSPFILCLETSAKACSVAVGQGDRCMVYKEITEAFKHSQKITLLIQEALDEAGITVKDLNAVAISAGPGSYTGLRVGTSCAKGLCFATDIPLIAVPTLDLIVRPYLNHEADIYIPMIDARRMEVYYNMYDSQGAPLSQTDNLILEQGSFEEKNDKKLLFCGDGAHKVAEVIQHPDYDIESSYPKAKHMVPLAFHRYKTQEFEDIAYYAPFYFKPPNITKSKKSLL